MAFVSYLLIFIATFTLISPGTHGGECNCHCRGFRNPQVCDNVESLWRVANTNTEKLLEWQRYRPFVERFSERWKEEIADIVEMKIEEYIAKTRFIPKPENLVSKMDDIQSDSPIPRDDGSDIVSNLVVKVEMVENRTIEVEEELKSERRVRRDLEKEVKETQTSLSFLGDQLQNVTVPVDAMMNQVQMVIHSSLEDMNKTIYEEHLKKLYYKVDGVVYKNETKKLDERLEHVETELHDGDNSSIVFKLAEELKALEQNLYLLNSSIGDNLVPRIETINNSIGDVLMPRLATLETETVRKNVTEELEGKMTSLLNNTELFRTALVDVWYDIQDIRNFEKNFQNFSEQWSSSLKQLQSQVELLKNESLSNRLTEPTDDSNEVFQTQLKDVLMINDTFVHQPYETDDAVGVLQRLKVENTTAEYKESKTWDHPGVFDRLNAVENDTVNHEVPPDVVDRLKIVEDYGTEDEENSTLLPEITPSVMDRGRIDGETTYCEKPEIKDSNLLVDVVSDSYGKYHLKFGCQPIGLYAVSQLPMPSRCEEGVWKEPFPSCTKLSNLTEIGALAASLREEHPCVGDIVELPDPTNCSQFFKCFNGKLSVIPCPPGLHFNALLKVCDYPRMAACVPSKSTQDEKLQALVPSILIEPDTIDRPGSHLGTGSTGQLIVHPRSSFTLHCLYPKNIWGYPKWSVTNTYSDRINRRYLIPKESRNRVSLTIRAAKEEDSGIYRCMTPFGVQHAIEVEVKVVVCPPFTMEEQYEDVYYRPSPEGELRIMGTRAEFQCEEGGRVFAQCMANGNWSREFPLNEECMMKKRKSDTTWNCKPLDASKNPDLILEKNDMQKIITFKCAGGKRLIGNSFVRCRDDGLWSHITLPNCKK